MKNNGSVTTIVTLTWVYGAKDIIYSVYSYIYMFLFAAMYLMGVKLCYFHQISLFRVVVVVVVVVGGDSLDCKI